MSADTPDVDKKTAKGLGEGGHSPHPATPEQPAPFDPHAYKRGDDRAKEPEANDKPIPPQSSTDPKGSGHESAEGGLPEKQPSTKRQ